jgi:hypothetical protein
MMTRYLIILFAVLFFAPLSSGAQEKQDTTLDGIVPLDAEGKITWQGVTEVKNAGKDSLYVKAIAWINKQFPNPSSVTTTRSPETGMLEGSYSIRLTDDHKGTRVPSQTVTYKFKLEFREGRFRYTFTEFNLKATSRFPLERWLDKNGPYYDPKNRDYLLQIKAHMEELIKSLTDFMTKPTPSSNDEW